ncbi:hypothetical protein HK100_001026 [Physocladia obscura]|uniref:BZIP domain-containing protein n=1 Tax=Physocladia obscura TaxID=109957 RepID=A0AAD5XGG9_9FUNG|nr:hypothetical protein HK100_001026 [Physocladia obscura]
MFEAEAPPRMTQRELKEEVISPPPVSRLPAISRKTIQNREAQRACRERKARQMANLKAENESLKAQIRALQDSNAQPNHALSHCADCALERMRSASYLARIAQLEAQLDAVKAQSPPQSYSHSQSQSTSPHAPTISIDHAMTDSAVVLPISASVTVPSSQSVQLPPPSASTIGSVSLSPLVKMDFDGSDLISHDEMWEDILDETSAIQLYGPIDIEPYRTAFNDISSIKGNPLIDQILDLFVEQAGATNKKKITKCLLGIVALRFALLDACSILDRARFLDAMDELTHQYNKYTTNMKKYFKVKVPPHDSIDWQNPRMTPFREQLRAVPSFSNAGNIIDDICVLYWSETKEDEREEKLLSIVLLARKLENLCVNDEDRKRVRNFET